MAVNFSPIFNGQVVDESGNPATSWKIYSYAAGSSTPQDTYTTSAGTVAQSNPIVINSLGFPTTGQIWLTAGLTYKLVLTDENDVVQKTEDNISGVNDVSTTADQWVASGLTPTYISATSFSLVGDQTTAFHVGRRLKTTNSGGTVYSTIVTSAYGALTTVTVVNDSGTLDAGLSAVSYGLLTATNPSTPLLTDAYPIVSGSSDKTKKLRFEVDGLTTATTRVATWPDASFTVPYTGSAGADVTSGVVTVPLRSYLAGCTLSTAGSSGTMSIAAGQCTDSTNVNAMVLAAIAKTTSAWAVGTGNGGLDTGAIANSTWYAFYVIKRTDTGVVDVVFSTNGTSPTMPANYTLYRRIGWGKTDGSAQWVVFTQYGDEFRWTVPVNDVNAQATATANRTARTLTAAPSTTVIADIYYRTSTTGVNEFCFLSSADMTDNAASVTNFSLTVSSATNTEYGSGEFRYPLNSSRQMYDRGSAAGTVGYMTKGWVDRRGKDS